MITGDEEGDDKEEDDKALRVCAVSLALVASWGEVKMDGWRFSNKRHDIGHCGSVCLFQDICCG